MLRFSVFVPVFNAEPWLAHCLDSIYRQDYPQELIEVILVDGGSTDKTLTIAGKYPVRVFGNEKKLAHFAFAIFGREARGDLVVMFASDNELVGRDWCSAVNECFERNAQLGALWGRQVSGAEDPAVNHYYELIQNDPLSSFTNRNLEFYMKCGAPIETRGRKGKVFVVDSGRSLTWGANGLVLRMDYVRRFFMADEFVGDNDIFQSMIEEGHSIAAYVPDLNVMHHHIRSVADWTRKLRRNFLQHFLMHRSSRNMGWAFGQGFLGRLILWVFYAGIPVFSGADALWRAMRDRNMCWLYHPVLSFIQLYTYATLTLFTVEGRAFAWRLLSRKGSC